MIRIHKSKDRQHNGKKKKFNRTNNDLQNITQKTDDWVTKTPLKTGGELRCSGRVGSSCCTSGTCLIKPWGGIKPKCNAQTEQQQNKMYYYIDSCELQNFQSKIKTIISQWNYKLSFLISLSLYFMPFCCWRHMKTSSLKHKD